MECLQVVFLCFLLKYNFDGALGIRTNQKKGSAAQEPIDIKPLAMPKPEDICDPEIEECDPNDIFYTFDGHCNNLKYSYSGQAELPFNRLLPARYSDGLCAPRKAFDGSDLPLERVIRTTVLPNNQIFTGNINMLFAGLGQFITHDVTFQKPIGLRTPPVTCCSDNKPDTNMDKDSCIPLIVPNDDKFYSKYNVTCLDQSRSTNTHTMGCKKEAPCCPINFATSVFDLSIVYTTSDDSADSLRTKEGGLLRTKEDDDSGHSFPEIISGLGCPLGGVKPEIFGSCFNIGDTRINQNPEITSMTILLLRMHNDIATKLQKINAHWSDEQLFQTARRILTAMYQVIVYKEHVPIIIGPKMTAFYNLNLAQHDYAEGYDEELDLRTLAEYEAAAGRALHSIIRGVVPYQDADGHQVEYRLRDKFFNQEFILNKETFLNLVTAWAKNKAEDQDKCFTNEVTDHQFMPLNAKEEYGTDLPATDISRGRDHGLAPYNDLREVCGLRRFTSFDDMQNEFKDPQDAAKLESLYGCVDDVDLYVGGVLEKPVPGGLLGPTLACISGESFQRWKFGDRRFLEFRSAKFEPEQLASLRQTTLAEILCTINYGQEYVYKHSFLIPSEENPEVKCSDVRKINLELWKEAPPASDSSSWF